MEPNNQNSNGMLNGIPQIPKQDRKIGPIIGVLVIVLVLIIASLFFFGRKLNTTPTTNETSGTQNSQTNNTASATDSTTQIQADLDAQLKNVDYSF